jgi:hypothetical protein
MTTKHYIANYLDEDMFRVRQGLSLMATSVLATADKGFANEVSAVQEAFDKLDKLIRSKTERKEVGF